MPQRYGAYQASLRFTDLFDEHGALRSIPEAPPIAALAAELRVR